MPGSGDIGSHSVAFTAARQLGFVAYATEPLFPYWIIKKDGRAKLS